VEEENGQGDVAGGITIPVWRMAQKKQMPTKSRAWLEAECLEIAKLTLGASEIQRVTIRRLPRKGSGPNWKVAAIIPQPTPLLSREVRDALAHLTGTYALEDKGRSPKPAGRPKGRVGN
jgi:hypothetical protein